MDALIGIQSLGFTHLALLQHLQMTMGSKSLSVWEGERRGERGREREREGERGREREREEDRERVRERGGWSE